MSASSSNSDSEETTIGYGPKRPLYGRRNESNRSSNSSASSRSSDLPILRRRDTDEQTWRKLRHKAAMDALQAAIASDEPELTPQSRSQQSCSSASSVPSSNSTLLSMTPLDVLSGGSPDDSNGGGRPLQLSGGHGSSTPSSRESRKTTTFNHLFTRGTGLPAHDNQSVSSGPRQKLLHGPHSGQNARNSKSRKRTLAATMSKHKKQHPAKARARSKFPHRRDQQTPSDEESDPLAAPVRRIKLSQIISSLSSRGNDDQSTMKKFVASSASDEESIGDIEESDDEDESIGERFDSNGREHDLHSQASQAQEWTIHAPKAAELQSDVVRGPPQPSVKKVLTAPSSWLAKASQELVANDTGTPTAIGSPGAKIKSHPRKGRSRMSSSSRHAFQIRNNASDAEDDVVPPQGLASRFIRLQRAHASELARFSHFRSKLANSQKRASQTSETSQSRLSQGPNVVSNFRWTDENPAALKLRVAHLYVVGAHRLACCEVVQHPTRPKQNEEGSASRGVLARTIVKSELHDRSDTSKPVVVDVLFAAQTTKRLRLQEGMSVRIFPPWLSVRKEFMLATMAAAGAATQSPEILLCTDLATVCEALEL